MKKAAIFGMAAFYLLLTTGMFVCIVHCAAESLISKPTMQMAHAGMAKHGDKKHCDGDSKDDCCKQHGSYVIKENLKPGFELQFAPTVAMVHQPVIADYLATYTSQANNTSWTDGKAPPWKSGRLISIQFHSLQI